MARDYQSIGEVLVTLKTEFPDVTISKIRFLEGEGLIDPERTASGYRQFAEREATFFEQIVTPMLRQRNPDARRAAADNLADLSALSRKLKQALLRSNLRQYLQG